MARQSVIDLTTANEKQKEFFKANQKYIAYGGARGGGKSWALQRKAIILCCKYPGYKCLILRRTYKDLERNHARELESLLMGFAKYNRQERIFTFPNGSIIELGYCAVEADVLQYQGIEYDAICFDEATQFSEDMFRMITASVRGTNDFPKKVLVTANPGGVGHEWVKRLFVDKKYRQGENADDYMFIPATVFDNKVLMEKDEAYVNMLNALPDSIRAAWRDGNWDMLAGRYFSDFERAVHVCEPFDIPKHWKRYCGMDYGLDCLAVVWVAIDEHGEFYVYREYAEPDKIIQNGAMEIADINSGENIEYVAAPPDMWGRVQTMEGKTKAALFMDNGLPLVRSSNDREAGWLSIAELLRPVDTGMGRKARLHIFSNCVNLIEYLPLLQRSVKHPTDCDTEPHNITHLPDALRYFCIMYTNPSDIPEEEEDYLSLCKQNRFKQIRSEYDVY